MFLTPKLSIGSLRRLKTVFQSIQQYSSHREVPLERITSHPTFNCPYLGSLPVQQDDVSKAFYMEIVNGSLDSAYQKYGPSHCTGSSEIPDKNSGKSVLIVGAGLSGLSAAFELEKIGYNTQILELQHRVGGRTKTLRDGFSTGLHAEGGAMRIPPNHYLTNGYIQKFGIPVRPFINTNENTWLYLDGEIKIRTKGPVANISFPQDENQFNNLSNIIQIGAGTQRESILTATVKGGRLDWIDNNKYYSTKLFPGWDANLPEEIRSHVNGILDLYDKTVQPVKDDLQALIETKGAKRGWEEWVEKWSKFSVDDFLRTNNCFDTISVYRPWPETAIRGFQISTYSPGFGMSLVEHLRDELGKWWIDPLHTPVDGMDTIANHFIKPQCGGVQKFIDLAKNIDFGTKVRTVKKNNEGKVEVTGRNAMTGKEREYTADAVIITVPLTILRQMDVDVNENIRRAIGNIHYQASTKVVLQSKSRFWEKQVGQGGFTKTDLPIGQLHYPSPCDPRPPNGRGLLVCYTWEQDALIFGSQQKQDAVDNAVREITKIHPEMAQEFEVGTVQAWFSDDAAQGAYASLQPYQYISGMKALMTPDHPVYLAGEAISYTNGWIQGALESGLNAAYHLYSHDRMK